VTWKLFLRALRLYRYHLVLLFAAFVVVADPRSAGLLRAHIGERASDSAINGTRFGVSGSSADSSSISGLIAPIVDKGFLSS